VRRRIVKVGVAARLLVSVLTQQPSMHLARLTISSYAPVVMICLSLSSVE
jgi:hypothetical protein